MYADTQKKPDSSHEHQTNSISEVQMLQSNLQ